MRVRMQLPIHTHHHRSQRSSPAAQMLFQHSIMLQAAPLPSHSIWTMSHKPVRSCMHACMQQVQRDLAAGRLPPVQPFHAMAYPFSADLAKAISAKYAEHCALTASRMGLNGLLPHPPAHPLAPGQRLRIGYVSSDFGNHPLSHLMASVFGLHNRSQVRLCERVQVVVVVVFWVCPGCQTACVSCASSRVTKRLSCCVH